MLAGWCARAATSTTCAERGSRAAGRFPALLRHTRESADLCVRQPAAGEGVRQPRECAESARHPDALARGAQIEPDAPRQPRGARAEAGVPATARVEFADEVQELRDGGVEVSGHLGDLIAKPIEICHELVSRVNVG